MYLCVMKQEYMKERPVVAVAAVAADPNTDPPTPAVEAVAAKDAVMGVRAVKCCVEAHLEVVRQRIDGINDYYEITFDADDAPLLSKVSLAGTAPKTIETNVLQNAKGDQLG